MKLLTFSKLACAIVILACFVLPLGQCTTPPILSGWSAPVEDSVDRPSPHTRVTYAWKEIKLSEPVSLLVIVFFTWPLALAIVRLRIARAWARVAVSIAEPICAAYSIAFVYAMLLFDELVYGGHIAIGSFVLFGALSVVQSGATFVHWMRSSRHSVESVGRA